MHISKILTKKIIVLGFGREGKSVIRFIRKHSHFQKICIADKKDLSLFSAEERKIIEDDPNITFQSGENYLAGLEHFHVIIKSPGIKSSLPQIQNAVKQNIDLTTPTNIFFSHVQGQTIGITGSKGKSTVATVVYQVLKEAGHKTYLCGNIGNPALDYLEYDSKKTYYVIELSSQQLENMEHYADIGIFTSFFCDHLDHHGDMKEYFAAKSRLFHKKTRIIYNRNYKKIHQFFQNNHFEHTISYPTHINTIEDDYFVVKGLKKIPTKNIKVKGVHNLENFLAVVLLADYLHISMTTVQNVLESFKGLPHRLEYIGSYGDVVFVNDSAAVNPNATVSALESLNSEKIGTLILGGMDRSYSFSKLAQKIVSSNIQNVVLFPNSGKNIKQELEKEGFRGSVLETKSMSKCVSWCYEKTPSGTICLLSPASPSYLQFKNFQERGEKFKAEIVKLHKKKQEDLDRLYTC